MYTLVKDIIIEAPRKGIPFVIFNDVGLFTTEGKTPARISLEWSYGGPRLLPSEYTIVYTTPDGKKHGQVISFKELDISHEKLDIGRPRRIVLKMVQ